MQFPTYWSTWNTETMHDTDVIMGTIASQITSFTIVFSAVYSDADQRKYESSASLALVRGFTGEAETGEFPAQMASNAGNVSIWWRHHGFSNNGCVDNMFYCYQGYAERWRLIGCLLTVSYQQKLCHGLMQNCLLNCIHFYAYISIHIFSLYVLPATVSAWLPSNLPLAQGRYNGMYSLPRECISGL